MTAKPGILASVRRGGGAVASIFDSFNRADGALGNLDSGGAWSVPSGTFSIASNRATTPSAGGLAIATGWADGTLEVDGLQSTVNGDVPVSSAVFRYSDASNFWYVYDYHRVATIALRKVQAGSDSQVASGSRTGSTGWHAYQVVLNGTAIEVWLDGVLLISTTHSFNVSATGVGMRASTGANAGCLWDNFSMVEG